MDLKKYVLIIDDEKSVAISIKNQIYAVFGATFTYEIALSGEDGIEIINEIYDNIDILVTISDWLMPGMKGDDFLIEIHKIVPDALKIMVTGQATDIAIQRAYQEANLHTVLNKPWRREELIAAISEFLKGEDTNSL